MIAGGKLKTKLKAWKPFTFITRDDSILYAADQTKYEWGACIVVTNAILKARGEVYEYDLKRKRK